MPVPALPLTLSWLTSPSADEDGVPVRWVPGASPAERRSLQRLGGLARALLRDTSAAGALDLPDDVAQWLRSGPDPDQGVVDECRKAVAAGADQTLADLYANIVRSSNRRRLGTFFTPDSEVRILLNRWSASQGSPTHIVDVGAGVGVFTVAASTQWPKARVHAVDINPVTLGLLAVRLAAGGDAGAARATRRSTLILGDYLEWLTTSWPALEGSRLVLGNPPYTRGSLIPQEDRGRLIAAGQGLAGSRASLSTIMTAASLKALGPKDGLCLLLPAQWLDTQYASALRTHLWALTNRRVELRLFGTGLFTGAQVDAVMLLVGVEGREPGLFVAADEHAEPRAIPRSETSPDRWHAMVAGTKTTPGPEPTVLLGSLAQIRRGTATGANGFFVLSADDAQRLEPAVKIRLLRRLGGVGDELDESTFEAALKGTRQWLLLATPEQRRADDALDAYLTRGEDALVNKRFLCSSRGEDKWFDLHHDLVTPDVVIGAMTKRRFQVVENRCSAAITNNLYGWTWKMEVSESTRQGVLAWLRDQPGQEALRSAAQIQGDHLFKIEPRALKELEVPAALVRP